MEMLKPVTRILQGEDGFTLVELMVVLVIIGIIVGIAVPKFTGYRVTAAEKACGANIRMIETAVVAYMAANNGEIPTMAELITENFLDPEPRCPFAETGDTAEHYIIDGSDGSVSCKIEH
jgi:prepilin-type N-terminal cleavage/methylation domain-containing protein